MRTPLFRGCMTQFLGGLDADWASFSEAVERLITLVRSKDGIESVVKNLDGKLSEAIMHAMTNGPELEKKVSNQLDCRDLGIKSAVSSSRNNTLGSRLLT
jgi:Glypican